MQSVVEAWGPDSSVDFRLIVDTRHAGRWQDHQGADLGYCGPGEVRDIDLRYGTGRFTFKGSTLSSVRVSRASLNAKRTPGKFSAHWQQNIELHRPRILISRLCEPLRPKVPCHHQRVLPRRRRCPPRVRHHQERCVCPSAILLVRQLGHYRVAPRVTTCAERHGSVFRGRRPSLLPPWDCLRGKACPDTQLKFAPARTL